MSLYDVLCEIDSRKYVAVEFKDLTRLYGYSLDLILAIDWYELFIGVDYIDDSPDDDCDLVIYLE